jgi:preprotein translocase subunit SecA
MRSGESGLNVDTLVSLHRRWADRTEEVLRAGFESEVSARYRAERRSSLGGVAASQSWRHVRRELAAEVSDLRALREELVGLVGYPIPASVRSEWEKTPRNAPCPCGSEKKFKACHGRTPDSVAYPIQPGQTLGYPIQPGQTLGGPTQPGQPEWEKTPRNAPCPCGSGKRFKACHGRTPDSVAYPIQPRQTLGYPIQPRQTLGYPIQPGQTLGGPTQPGQPEWEKTPRNAPCPCGSGKRYKACHGR